MKITEVKIEITDDLLDKLKKAAQKSGDSINKHAANIIKLSLEKDSKDSESKRQFPSVALVKETAVMHSDRKPEFVKHDSQSSKQDTSSFSFHTKDHTRKEEIEGKMKELSLLIETSDDSRKTQKYLMQYASLAAELNALL